MANRKKRIVTIVLAISIAMILVLALMSIFSHRPDNIGLHDGQLAPCPDSPNAVSTTATDAQHQMSPIPFSGSATDAIQQLQQIVAQLPRTKIINITPNYLYAEFTSTIFRFVDDVEFHADQAAQVIHFRSASRAGHSDFGANRRRMQKITSAFIDSKP